MTHCGAPIFHISLLSFIILACLLVLGAAKSFIFHIPRNPTEPPARLQAPYIHMPGSLMWNVDDDEDGDHDYEDVDDEGDGEEGADEDDRNTFDGQISLGSLAGSTSVTRNLSIKNTNTL